MEIHGVPCTVAALSEEERIVEIRLESDQGKSNQRNGFSKRKHHDQDSRKHNCLTHPDHLSLFQLFFPQEEKEKDRCGLGMSFWFR